MLKFDLKLILKFQISFDPYISIRVILFQNICYVFLTHELLIFLFPEIKVNVLFSRVTILIQKQRSDQTSYFFSRQLATHVDPCECSTYITKCQNMLLRGHISLILLLSPRGQFLTRPPRSAQNYSSTKYFHNNNTSVTDHPCTRVHICYAD